jgi:two-component SAPR family response regulator
VPVAYEAHRILGQSCLALGRLDEGEVHLRQALAHCAEQGSDFERASIQSALVDCLWRQGRWEEAIAVQEQIVETRRRLDSPGLLSGALNDLGFFLYSTGEYNEALELFAEALALARRSGHRRNEALTLISLGELLRDLGALNQAAAACEAGLALADDLGDAFLSAYGREALGLTLRWQGDYAAAQVALDQALERAERQGSEYQAGRYGASLGLVWVEAGETAAGLATLERACERLERIGARSELARARFFEAWALFQAGQEQRALADLRRVLASGDLPSRNLLFVVEGRRALPMLERASRQGMGNAEIAVLVARARAFARAAQDVLDKAASLEIKIGSGKKAITGVKAEPDLRVYGFGKGRAARGGKEIHISKWGAAATRWMLFFMLIHRRQSREQIAVVLWPDLETRKVKANFHTTQFRLDRAVGQDTLYYENGLYRIHPEFDYWFDVEEFEKLLREPEKDPGRRVIQLRRAAKLYTGDFLEDCYTDWAVRRREALREQYAEAMDELARRLIGQRQYREAIEALGEGLQIDNMRERFYNLLMRAYALSGQPDQAVAQYQRCVQVLHDELKTSPSRETTALCERIKKGLPID